METPNRPPNRLRPSQNCSEAGTNRIPVSILTGFLGAGKTTLLNALVSLPDSDGTAVFINELGAVGIDHHLVEKIDDALVILDSGCLCCTVQGDLMQALMRLHDRIARREIKPVRRVLIETTGMADPAPVVRALTEDRLVSARFRCDGLLTVVDTERARTQLAHHREAMVQVAMADRLILSKCDLAGRAERAALERDLAAINPSAPRIEARRGNVSWDALFGAGVYAAETGTPNWTRWLQAAPPASTRTGDEPHGHEHHHAHPSPHGSRIRSFVVTLDPAPGWRGLTVVLGDILTDWSGRLLRVKGLVDVAGLPGPVVVQCVDATAYSPVNLPEWPRDGALADQHGRLVFIGEGLTDADETAIRDRLAACPGDREALRRAAARLGMPTRNWLSERMPLAPAPGLQSPAFLIQPRYLRDARAQAG
ncbi:CobW family GTP-binding protein [Novosphingobium naphthalenivorans]|uniref:CobW family GTP-binding protein n=1 Tax=Novosphingobium naphthalenivorans TaxID=273168 RepID=UPI000A02FC2D|nr:GTP-binding protein [Novosphingobium naphthalenivorans]